MGTTVVTWTATDAAGNAGTATQDITVTNALPEINGAQLYASYCAVCHGDNRRGGFYGGIPPEKLDGDSDAKLFDITANGKGSMPGYSGSMTTAEIIALVQFLRTPTE